VKKLMIAATVVGLLFVAGLVTAFVLVAAPEPRIAEPKDVFGFATPRQSQTAIEPPKLQRYPARDGEQLAYRFYDSTAQRILIFIHGSSYHGGGYHALASAISLGGIAKVILPNLRGHYQSGRRRGDVDYIGQLEDDLDDLIKFLRSRAPHGSHHAWRPLQRWRIGDPLCRRRARGRCFELSAVSPNHSALAVGPRRHGGWLGHAALAASATASSR
jgi:hypothetical protein